MRKCIISFVQFRVSRDSRILASLERLERLGRGVSIRDVGRFSNAGINKESMCAGYPANCNVWYIACAVDTLF